MNISEIVIIFIVTDQPTGEGRHGDRENKHLSSCRGEECIPECVAYKKINASKMIVIGL